MKGSDGFRYQFLLKGKEDLRLDERVMQLFDLMNNLIQMNNELRKKDLEVIRYSITPITNNHNDFGGLLRWIDNSGWYCWQTYLKKRTFWILGYFIDCPLLEITLAYLKFQGYFWKMTMVTIDYTV